MLSYPNCIGIGRGVIKALGFPTHVSLKVSDSHNSISVFSCDEDDSVKVSTGPAQNKKGRTKSPLQTILLQG